MKWSYYQRDVNQINLNHTTLWNFSNIQSLQSNFVEYESFLEWNSTDIKLGWFNWFWQFLCEKLFSFNLKGFMHDLAVYVKEGLAFAHDLSLENSSGSYLFSTGFTSFGILLFSPLSITFFIFVLCFIFFILYYFNIDEVLLIKPSNVFIFDDFNIHHKD